MPIETILAAVHPFATGGVAGERSVQLAHKLGAQLHLQSVVWQPDLAHDLFHIARHHEEDRSRLETNAQKHLVNLAQLLEDHQVHRHVDWGHPFDARLLESVAQHQPDLVVMELSRNKHPSTAEWRFIRQCGRPLLLCQRARWADSPKIMACVDPTHAHNKPEEIDARVLATSGQLAHHLGLNWEILHAAGMTPDLHGDQPYTYQYREQQDSEREAQIRALLPADQSDQTVVNFSHSTPAESITAFVKERDIDICVLGLVNRSRVSELLIGSTPRALIGKVDCDLLLLPHPAAGDSESATA